MDEDNLEDCWTRTKLVYQEFYVHDSVYRNSILIRCNNIQQYAGIYLLQNYSTW